MPSIGSPDGRTLRVAVFFATLAVLAAALPVTTVAGPSADGDATAARIASDRATCPQNLAPTDGVGLSADASSMPTNASPPTSNESADLTVARGDIAVVPLSVPAGENVSVAVGSGDGYSVQLDVSDDGDGEVRLLVNTYLAGNRTTVAPDAYRAAGDDAVTVLGGTPAAEIEPGSYPVAARLNGTVVAERRLTVTEPSFESVTARRGVPRLFEATNASEVRTASGSGLTGPLVPGEYDPEVVEGETLLLRIDAPSLLGAIAAKPGNTTTERFLALTREVGPETDETFTIMGPCGGIQFAKTAAEGGARVLLDHREGAVYVLLDTTNLVGLAAGGQSVFVEVRPESRINGMDEELELRTDFRITGRSTSMPPNASGVVPLSATDRAHVTGKTNLLPGSRVLVRVESRVEPTFERRATATVAENGTFTAKFDLSNASNPGLFAVHVGRHQFPAEVGDPPSVHWKLNQRRIDEPITDFTLDRLDLPDGGFLVAYRYDDETNRFRPVGSATASDDELAVKPLTQPQHLLVVAHRDDGDGTFDGPSADPPYSVDGRPVHDWMNVSVGGVAPDADEPTATFDADQVVTPTMETRSSEPDAATTTTDPKSGTTATTEATTSITVPGSTTSPDATDAEIPGLGPLPSVLALVIATALAVVARWSRRLHP